MLNFKIHVKPLLSQTDLGGAGSDLVLEIGPLAQNRAAFQLREDPESHFRATQLHTEPQENQRNQP